MTSLISTGVENTFGTRPSKPGRLLGKKNEETIQGILVEHHEQDHKQGGGGGHGEGDGTWIYSFADLIMNLLMFFIMMFAISSIDKNKLAKVQEAFSSHNAEKKAQGANDAGNAGGVQAAGWTPQESMSNAEILAKVKELMGRIDDGFLKSNSKMNTEVVTLKSQLEKLSKQVDAEWRYRPELQGFDIAIPARKVFNQNTVELSKTGRETLQKIAAELGALNHTLKINVMSFTASETLNFDVTSKRANAVATILANQPKLKSSELSASGTNTNSLNILGNEKTLGLDPVLIRVSALMPVGSKSK